MTKDTFAYVGTYTKSGSFNGQGQGLHAFRFDGETGNFEPLSIYALPDPTWLELSVSRPLLYAGMHSNRFEGSPGAGIVTYQISESGVLKRVGNLRLDHPHVAHLCLDSSQQFLIASSSLGGAVSSIELDVKGIPVGCRSVVVGTGEPAVRKGQMPVSLPSGAPNFPNATSPGRMVRGRHTQPHFAMMHRSNRFVFVGDLQQQHLEVLSFDVNSGKLNRHFVCDIKEAGGPRALAIHDSLDYLYCATLDMCIAVAAFDPITGSLSLTDVLNLSQMSRGEISGGALHDIVLDDDASGFWTVSRDPGQLARFQLDANGRASYICAFNFGGSHARSLTKSPDGHWLIASGTYDSALFSVELDPSGNWPTGVINRTDVPNPSCVVFAA